jgi:alpha-tubulin suppressor-like RCC1 family protein
MKAVLSSRRHRYVARVIISLLTLAVIAGMVGCGGGGGVISFHLTVSDTGGGHVTAPGEGTFAYNQGTVVNLVATPDPGHRFAAWSGDVSHIANVNDAATTIDMEGDYSIRADFEYTPMVAAGWYHTVGLKSDGTVVAVGYNDYGQCNLVGWTDIVQVAAGVAHTVGLKSDGTVVAVGDNGYGQCNVAGCWTGIVQIAAGWMHTVGLKSDGTVVAVGWNGDGECDVAGWAGIGQIAAGEAHTVGLKSDGTVVAVGWNNEGQCNVVGWTDIVQIAAGNEHTVGLKFDGTVVATGDNSYGQCNVAGWYLS